MLAAIPAMTATSRGPTASRTHSGMRLRNASLTGARATRAASKDSSTRILRPIRSAGCVTKEETCSTAASSSAGSLLRTAHVDSGWLHVRAAAICVTTSASTAAMARETSSNVARAGCASIAAAAALDDSGNNHGAVRTASTEERIRTPCANAGMARASARAAASGATAPATASAVRPSNARAGGIFVLGIVPAVTYQPRYPTRHFERQAAQGRI